MVLTCSFLESAICSAPTSAYLKFVWYLVTGVQRTEVSSLHYHVSSINREINSLAPADVIAGEEEHCLRHFIGVTYDSRSQFHTIFDHDVQESNEPIPPKG